MLAQTKETDGVHQLFVSLNSKLCQLQAIHQQRLTLQDEVIDIFSELVNCRDAVTGEHAKHTEGYLKILATAMLEHGVYTDEAADWDLDFLFSSAQLHDVGKIVIKNSILQKLGALTQEEYDEIKKHTVFGVWVLDEFGKRIGDHDFLKQAKILAGTHHERWDGEGYPFGFSGHDIPLQGRLMAIADVYDALVSERPYKKPFTHEQAVDIIVDGRGSQFDPVLVDLFESVESMFKRN